MFILAPSFSHVGSRVLVPVALLGKNQYIVAAGKVTRITSSPVHSNGLTSSNKVPL